MANKQKYSAVFTGLWNNDGDKAEFVTVQKHGQGSRNIFLRVHPDDKEKLNQFQNIQVNLISHTKKETPVEQCLWRLDI